MGPQPRLQRLRVLSRRAAGNEFPALTPQTRVRLAGCRPAGCRSTGATGKAGCAGCSDPRGCRAVWEIRDRAGSCVTVTHRGLEPRQTRHALRHGLRRRGGPAGIGPRGFRPAPRPPRPAPRCQPALTKPLGKLGKMGNHPGFVRASKVGNPDPGFRLLQRPGHPLPAPSRVPGGSQAARNRKSLAALPRISRLEG
jgi:hypothetical protein